ncbi:MAG TPA: hypothetical protein VGM26_11745 [Rhizomicrobium sp.]|jgi:hypothetical protein
MFSIAKTLAVACALLCATPALAADRRIYKIDSVIATLSKKGVLVIQAKGAVQGGGWAKPHLHILHNDGRMITVEFLAAPPPPGMTVIDGLVPIAAAAQMKIKPRSNIGSVHAIADANEVTTQVLR